MHDEFHTETDPEHEPPRRHLATRWRWIVARNPLYSLSAALLLPAIKPRRSAGNWRKFSPVGFGHDHRADEKPMERFRVAELRIAFLLRQENCGEWS